MTRPLFTETQQMRDNMTGQQRLAAVIDVLRETMVALAVDEFSAPRLTWAPRSWLAYWRDRWSDSFRPHNSCLKMRGLAARAMDEVAEITGQSWRGLHRTNPVRPQGSPYKIGRKQGPIGYDGKSLDRD